MTFRFCLFKRTPQNIRATGRQSRKRLADLQNMFLIDDEAIGAFQTWFQRRMRIDNRLHALITPREGEFLSLVCRTGADDAHNRHQPVNFPHVTHPAKAGHGGAFDMMDGAGVAARNHFPHFGVLPRLDGLRITVQDVPALPIPRHTSIQINFNPPFLEHGFNIAHRRQAALRQNIHLNEANCLDRIHIQMRGRITLVGNECCGEFAHRLARQHHAARVHFRITRHPVQKCRRFQGGLIGLIPKRQVTIFRTCLQHFNQARRRQASAHPAPTRPQSSTESDP